MKIKKINRQWKWQKKKRSLGLCITCGDKVWRKGAWYCERHRQKDNKSHKLRYHLRKPTKMNILNKTNKIKGEKKPDKFWLKMWNKLGGIKGLKELYYGN